MGPTLVARTPSLVTRPFGVLGRGFRGVAEHAGELWFLLVRSIHAVLTLRVSLRSVLQQIHVMGVQSVPIVLVTAVLAGIVTSQQGGYQFQGSIPLYILGSIVASSVVLELGPVLTAVVLVGRVGARITAELGTMQVSEQIEAFHAVGRDPIAVLAAPRILAGVIVVPILVGIADVVGIASGMISAEISTGLGPEGFLYGARLYWHSWDLFYSFAKAVTFGFAIPIIAIHMGFRTQGGAAGVGRTTTASVMFMTLTILILDALFPPLLLQ